MLLDIVRETLLGWCKIHFFSIVQAEAWFKSPIKVLMLQKYHRTVQWQGMPAQDGPPSRPCPGAKCPGVTPGGAGSPRVAKRAMCAARASAMAAAGSASTGTVAGSSPARTTSVRGWTSPLPIIQRTGEDDVNAPRERLGVQPRRPVVPAQPHQAECGRGGGGGPGAPAVGMSRGSNRMHPKCPAFNAGSRGSGGSGSAGRWGVGRSCVLAILRVVRDGPGIAGGQRMQAPQRGGHSNDVRRERLWGLAAVHCEGEVDFWLDKPRTITIPIIKRTCEGDVVRCDGPAPLEPRASG